MHPGPPHGRWATALPTVCSKRGPHVDGQAGAAKHLKEHRSASAPQRSHGPSMSQGAPHTPTAKMKASRRSLTSDDRGLPTAAVGPAVNRIHSPARQVLRTHTDEHATAYTYELSTRTREWTQSLRRQPAGALKIPERLRTPSEHVQQSHVRLSALSTIWTVEPSATQHRIESTPFTTPAPLVRVQPVFAAAVQVPSPEQPTTTWN